MSWYLITRNNLKLILNYELGQQFYFQQYFCYIVEEIGVPGENHRPAASNWETL